MVVPCLDEERTVGRVVREALRTLSDAASAEVLVIDDGSSDATFPGSNYRPSIG